jgi:RNA polymerase sigma factor (sigma-70 family)
MNGRLTAVADRDRLAGRFEAHRLRLRAVAHRMLDSPADADDAVQEAWLRLHRVDPTGVRNLGGWLTTTVGRVCLDMLRTRESQREELRGTHPPDPVDPRADPEHQAVLTESVGTALHIIQDTLGPAERLALVFHDMFAVPFDDIGPLIGRSPTAARQLASRARRRIEESAAAPTVFDGSLRKLRETDRTWRDEAVSAFRAAAHQGDFAALLSMLDPDLEAVR